MAAAAQLLPILLLPKVKFVLFDTVLSPRRAVFLHWRVKRSSNPYIPLGDADLNTRKEAVMSSVRNELALANAQELINVRGYSPNSHAPCIMAVPNI